MSDSVTNVEIEDVLSSIRRLVAEGDRSRHGAAGTANARPEGPAKGAEPIAAATTPPAAAARGRFVLTPALRVEGDDEARRDEDAGTPRRSARITADAPFIAVDAEDEARRETRAEGAQTGGPAPAATGAPTPALRDWSRLEATIAELEAAVTRQPDEWEPDGSEDSPVLGWRAPVHAPDRRPAETGHDILPAAVTPAPGRVGPAGDGDFAEAPVAPEPDEAQVPFLHRRAVASPGRTAAAGDTRAPAATSPGGVAQGPTGTGQRDAAEGPMGTAARVAEQGPTAAAAGEATPMPVPRAGETRGGHLPIDEELLRAMISDAIREELQGKLGESITHNLRKMIRREVQRALSSYDQA